MKKIVIGTLGEKIDLDILLETRLLIQANSGGGKSYLVRRIAEQMFGQVQVIIIDPEGDFATLREQFDFLLVAKDGDIPADVRSAGMLAEKLLELNASAICDLYEMKVRDRHEWVKAFLTAMINAPKKLWHPVVIIVDEAHVFAPEKGQGESSATDAMIDLASRGRKRGFCGIFATQRLGKFNKNVAAELQNVLIGSTFIDIDRKRAAETLGIPRAEDRQFSADMKVMEPGNFYALGRALTKERQMVRIAETTTTHLRSGAKRKSSPPPASDRVTAMLSSLKDLPAQAEQKVLTESELRKELQATRKELDRVRKEKVLPPNPPPAVVDTALIDEITTLVQDNLATLFGHVTKANEIIKELTAFKSSLERSGKADISLLLARLVKLRKAPSMVVTVKPGPPTVSLPAHSPGQVFNVKHNGVNAGQDLPEGEALILRALIQYAPKGLTGKQLSVLADYRRSTRDAYIQRLTQKGLVTKSGGMIQATEDGIKALPDAEPLPTGTALQEYWMGRLPEGEARILQALIDVYPHSLLREQLDEQLEFKRSTRDAYIQRMTAKELLEFPAPGNVKASSNLFDL